VGYGGYKDLAPTEHATFIRVPFCAFCAFRLRKAYGATSFCGYSLFVAFVTFCKKSPVCDLVFFCEFYLRKSAACRAIAKRRRIYLRFVFFFASIRVHSRLPFAVEVTC